MGKVKGKALLFTKHIFDRAKGREIPVGLIIKVIKNPQISYPTPLGTVHLESEISGKRIVVIVDEKKKKYIIVSCWEK